VRPLAGNFGSTLGHRRLLLVAGTCLVLCFVLYVVTVFAPHPRAHWVEPLTLLGAAIAACVMLALSWRDLRRDAAAVEQLRESDARFRLLMAQLPAGVWTTDAALRVKTVFGSAVRRLEDARAQAPDGSLYDVFGTTNPAHPAIAAHLRALGGESAQYERAEGDVVLEAHVDPLRDGTGAVVGCVGVAVNVGERRAAEQQVRVLANALEGASDMISVTDAENRFVYVNQAFLRAYGYGRDEVLGRTPAILGSSEEWQRVIVSATLADAWTGDLVNRAKDGTEVPVSLHTTAIRDAEGRTLGLLGVARDISERKRAEEALRRSQERFELAALATDEIIWEQDFGTGATWWSRSLERVLGYAPETVKTGEEWWRETIHPDDRERVLRGWQRAVGGRELYWTDEFRLRRSDGEHAVVSSLGYIVRDAAGKALRMVGSLADITFRRQAQVVAGRYAALVESSQDAIISTDLEGLVETWNQAAERLYGYSAEEMIGRPVSVLEPAELAGEGAAFRRRVIAGEHPPSYETTRRQRDGSLVKIATALSPILDGTGGLIGVSAVVRDITERKRAEQRLRESEEQLRALAAHLESAREEERARMARGIHDELGQMLTALRLDITWLARRVREPSAAVMRKMDEMIAMTDESIEASRRIVADLRPPILDDLGLVPAVQWYAEHLGKRAGLRVRVLTRGGEPALDPRLTVTAYRIVQEALTNVARHATARNVEVRIGTDDGNLLLEVSDDGCGIPASAASDRRAFGIAGMRERARSGGGTLEVSGVAGGGTLVRVVMPHQRPLPPEASA
jgi:PAS domain S-box-containing protein